MKKRLLLLFFLTSVITFAKAQDANTFKPKTDSLIQTTMIRAGRSAYPQYTLNGVVLTKNTLEERLMSYDKSAVELSQYKLIRKQSRTEGIICGALGIGALVAAGIQINHQGYRTGSTFSRAPVFCSISILGLVGEFVCLCRHNDHFAKALTAYNSRF